MAIAIPAILVSPPLQNYKLNYRITFQNGKDYFSSKCFSFSIMKYFNSTTK